MAGFPRGLFVIMQNDGSEDNFSKMARIVPRSCHAGTYDAFHE
jgi:hypothetical protein